MKQLVIAEKPSVAKDLAAALGKFTKEKDFFENDTYIITSAVGHIVELFMPEDFDPQWKSWKPSLLPILPEQFKLKAIAKSKDRFSVIKKLMQREDVESMINACDAGREGELIFAYIYELSKTKKPFQRLWLSSMTPAAICTAFQHLKTAEEMRPLEDAARCRSESDWVIGINGTRVLTNKMSRGMGRGVSAVGRVQTPTLTLVVDREHEIRTFKSRPFWSIEGEFKIINGIYKGVLQRSDFKKSDDVHDRSDRIWTKKDAEAIVSFLSENQRATVEEKKKRTKQIAPRLYDLTTLQREANSRFGFSASSTLAIAQSLYERHKVLTYPRTDSKALPEDYAPVCLRALQALPSELQPFAQKIQAKNWVNPHVKRNFNNKDVSDHFAIIPTDQTPSGLSPQEQKIYDMVAKRFLAAFYPEAEFDVTTRISHVDVYAFKTEGKVLVEAGWLEVYGREGAKEELPALCEADGKPTQAHLNKTELIEDATKPPPRYTEATLLSAMENAGKLVEDEELAEAMKERGLGTPATRAQTIEHLIALKYIDRDKKDLFPNPKAEDVIAFLKITHIEDLTSPAMTGEWEYKLRKIQEGTFSRKAFMKDIYELAKNIVEKTMLFKESTDTARFANISAPTDGKPLIDTLNAYKSQDGKFTIYKTIGNRRMEDVEIQKLINERKVGPLEGFRSKYGKPYVATLELDDTNKVRFVFENAKDSFDTTQVDLPTKEELASYDVMGKCPCCEKGNVYDTPNAYLCENYLKSATPCKFRVTRTLLTRQVPPEQFMKLIKDRKTDVLDKFKSKRTGKYFSASLILKKSGEIGFEFPQKAESK